VYVFHATDEQTDRQTVRQRDSIIV